MRSLDDDVDDELFDDELELFDDDDELFDDEDDDELLDVAATLFFLSLPPNSKNAAIATAAAANTPMTIHRVLFDPEPGAPGGGPTGAPGGGPMGAPSGGPIGAVGGNGAGGGPGGGAAGGIAWVGCPAPAW